MISKKVIRTEGPVPIDRVKCIKCGNHKNPAFCYTGSILGGACNTSRVTQQGGDLLGVMDTFDKSYLIRTEVTSVVHRVRFHKRIKGYICSDCASDYRVINGQPVVKVDSRIIGQSMVPQIERRMDSVSPAQKSSPTSVAKAVRNSPALNDNHWLDVGKRNK